MPLPWVSYIIVKTQNWLVYSVKWTLSLSLSLSANSVKLTDYKIKIYIV